MNKMNKETIIALIIILFVAGLVTLVFFTPNVALGIKIPKVGEVWQKNKAPNPFKENKAPMRRVLAIKDGYALYEFWNPDDPNDITTTSANIGWITRNARRITEEAK